MKNISFKLIFRSWWRNKTFTVISILSLAVGIACTNLLAAFVIHEYNIEADNPNKDRIYCILQDSPLQVGDKVFYASDDIPPMIKDRYPEVGDFLRLSAADIGQINIGETIYDPIMLLLAEASFSRFFPYQTVLGNLEEALTEPNKIALTEATARRFFGKENPIGQTIYAKNNNPGGVWRDHTLAEGTTYQVVAVIREDDQSILKFDALTAQPQKYGGTSFLLMNQPVDMEAFALRLQEDGIPIMLLDQGRYYFSTLQENYFNEYRSQYLPYIRMQNKLTLYIGLFSALLILLIACFNYINLNFSRLLQQVKMIHVQKLMGASRTDINKQLFFDIFLTVLCGFVLSLLIMYDLIPVFNSILAAQMKASFFFSGQVIPFLVGLVLILSVIPAIYVGRKINSLSRQCYLDLSGGKKKQSIISVLSVIQFTISIALIIATLTVNQQLGLIRDGGEGYRELIEIGSQTGNNTHMAAFVEELRAHADLGEINTTESSILNSDLLRQIVTTDPEGNEIYLSLLDYSGDTGFLSTFDIHLLQGLPPDQALQHYASPVYVNERFADVFIAKEENPIGKPLKSYDKDFDSQNREDGSKENPITTIAGIVQNFFTGSLEEEVSPAIIRMKEGVNDGNVFIYFRLDKKHPDRLAKIKQIWEKHYPDKRFDYRSVYQDFIARNQKAFGLANLLLMYSLISIFLTCFGLFGIALYAARQRTKEIGIRKVNGAKNAQIVALLNRQFLTWIGIAFIIAVPVSWLLLNRWLQGFVYRTEISAGVFLIALLAVAAIAILTVSWHSYKAASGNPVNALRDE